MILQHCYSASVNIVYGGQDCISKLSMIKMELLQFPSWVLERLVNIYPYSFGHTERTHVQILGYKFCSVISASHIYNKLIIIQNF